MTTVGRCHRKERVRGSTPCGMETARRTGVVSQRSLCPGERLAGQLGAVYSPRGTGCRPYSCRWAGMSGQT